MAVRAYRSARPPHEAPRRVPVHAPPAPRSRRGLVVTKMIAMLLLFGASGLLYHVAASDDFRITNVVVTGATLVSPAEIEQAAATNGLNIFWVRQEEVGHRLQAISADRKSVV